VTVKFATEGRIAIVTLDRPEVRNAVDQPTDRGGAGGRVSPLQQRRRS
jgi:hypothetical protein